MQFQEKSTQCKNNSHSQFDLRGRRHYFLDDRHVPCPSFGGAANLPWGKWLGEGDYLTFSHLSGVWVFECLVAGLSSDGGLWQGYHPIPDQAVCPQCHCWDLPQVCYIALKDQDTFLWGWAHGLHPQEHPVCQWKWDEDWPGDDLVFPLEGPLLRFSSCLQSLMLENNSLSGWPGDLEAGSFKQVLSLLSMTSFDLSLNFSLSKGYVVLNPEVASHLWLPDIIIDKVIFTIIIVTFCVEIKMFITCITVLWSEFQHLFVQATSIRTPSYIVDAASIRLFKDGTIKLVLSLNNDDWTFSS